MSQLLTKGNGKGRKGRAAAAVEEAMEEDEDDF